jgi:hypothetical protein
MPKQCPQRCNARTRQNDAALYRASREGRLVEYLRRAGHHCRNWPERGQKRCRFHGGRATGPTTPDGMARTVAAMTAGRARWLAELKSEGKPIPCGRKKGGRNLPREEREQIAREKRRRQEGRLMLQRLRADRKARRVRERGEDRRRMEDHVRRKARADAGLPYWTEEELENL